MLLKNFIKNYFKHFCVLILFCLISLLYFSPVLQGKKIWQTDIVQYAGMAKEHIDFREETGQETYWTNSAFSGMPTYQLGAKYPHNYIKKLDLFLRFLPRPADYLFLYFLGFYILMLSLKVEYRLAVLGALAFGFSTYLIIIIGAGHNAKAHAIGYMPLVLAGIILVFRKKYYLGFIVSTLALGLQFCANHFQMTYYLMFIIIILGIYYLIDKYKTKELNSFFLSISILFTSLLFALLMNSSILMTTYEYMQESTRGSSELTLAPTIRDGKVGFLSQEELNKGYSLMWSYGVFESINLFIPRIMGGGSTEELGVDSNFYNALRKEWGVSALDAKRTVKRSPTYWGDQTFVLAPAYLGISVFFLFVFSVFLTKGKEKKWIITAICVSLLLSYGKNFILLTDIFMGYFPFYNKFRAVTSIQVIIELCVPLLALIGINKLFKEKDSNNVKYLYYTLSVFIIIILSLFLLKGLLDFRGNEMTSLTSPIIDALIMDRMAMYDSELFRALTFISIMFLVLWGFLKEKINKNLTLICIGLIILIDLVPFNRKYVNNSNFVDSDLVENPYQLDEIYRNILRDEADYRVFDSSDRTTKSNYFLNSVNGYHGAKLASYDAILRLILDSHKQEETMNILSMLNTKYIILPDEKGKKIIKNNLVSGSGWFIENIFGGLTRDEEVYLLLELNFKKVVISKDLENKIYVKNNLSTVKLIEKSSNYLKYRTSNENDGFVVFSEIFYPHGWISSIDGIKSPHHRVNYLLRGMEVPKGEHIIEFKFDPEVVKTSSKISLAGSSIFFILIILLGYFKFKKQQKF